MNVRRSISRRGVVLLFAFLISRNLQAVEYRDDFEEGGQRLDWDHKTDCLGGEWRVEGGKLVLADPLSLRIGTWLLTPFSGNVSVRTQATSTANGYFACFLHGSACKNAYWGTVNFATGEASIGRTVNASGTILASTFLGNLTPGEEVILQFDRIRNRLELRAWRPGENPPADPLSATDETFSSGSAGVFYEPWTTGAKGVFEYVEITNHPPPEAAFTITPEAGLAPLEVVLDASASAAAEGGRIVLYSWNFGDGNVEETAGASLKHIYREPGLYRIQLTATDDSGVVSSKVTYILAVGCPPADTAPWAAADIGAPAYPGSARIEGTGEAQAIHLCTGGTGFSSTDDALFLYRELTGDFRITARVSELANYTMASRIGVLFRESLDAGSRSAATLLERPFQADPSIRFTFRLQTDGSLDESTMTKPGGGFQGWIRIERRGDVFTASSSVDGQAWSELGSQEIPWLPATLLGGVAAARGGAWLPGSKALHAVVTDLEAARPLPDFRRGDCNGDGEVSGSVTDPIFFLQYNFLGGAAPPCRAACDANGDGDLSGVTDAIYLLEFNFLGGPRPAAPFPDCGPGELEKDAELGCDSPPATEACQ
ncbi:MAG: PKD domain-containing protein [Planctomycetes bacterium]|nr:PKD domain-containing protein [Planctomycetota bacterium]